MISISDIAEPIWPRPALTMASTTARRSALERSSSAGVGRSAVRAAAVMQRLCEARFEPSSSCARLHGGARSRCRPANRRPRPALGKELVEQDDSTTSARTRAIADRGVRRGPGPTPQAPSAHDRGKRWPRSRDSAVPGWSIDVGDRLRRIVPAEILEIDKSAAGRRAAARRCACRNRMGSEPAARGAGERRGRSGAARPPRAAAWSRRQPAERSPHAGRPTGLSPKPRPRGCGTGAAFSCCERHRRREAGGRCVGEPVGVLAARAGAVARRRSPRARRPRPAPPGPAACPRSIRRRRSAACRRARSAAARPRCRAAP